MPTDTPTPATRRVGAPNTQEIPRDRTAAQVEQEAVNVLTAMNPSLAQSAAARLSPTPRAEKQKPPELERWVTPGTLAFMREVPASLLTRMAIRQEFNLLPPKATAAAPLTFEILATFLIDKFRTTPAYKNFFVAREDMRNWGDGRMFNPRQSPVAEPNPPRAPNGNGLVLEEAPNDGGPSLEPDGSYNMRNIRVDAIEHGSCRDYRAPCQFNGQLRIPRDVVLGGATAVREFITQNLSNLTHTISQYIYAGHQPRRLSDINPSFDQDTFDAALARGPRRV